MAELVLLYHDNGKGSSEIFQGSGESHEIIECNSLDDALEKAISRKKTEGRIWVKVTPEGSKGGPVLALEFDRNSCDWKAFT